jgi:2-oxoglutarate dehydrogenase E1 component
MSTSTSSATSVIRPSVNGWNGDYLDGQYETYKADPLAVPSDVRAFFDGFELGNSGGCRPLAGSASPFQSAVDELINAYREVGHLAATLDPFGRPRPRPEALNPSKYGLTESDLQKPAEAALDGLSANSTLAELIAYLEATYCRNVGVEFMHIPSAQEREWFLRNFEQTRGVRPMSGPEQVHVLKDVARGEGFENFLYKRYTTEKRFGLEGGIALIPMMTHMIDRGANLGVEEMVLGMAHRGRLNVLINIMGKAYEQVFTEFEDSWEAGFANGGGDVKYHRGYSGQRTTVSGKTINLTLASNPSHLESVNPVVIGRTRAKQRHRKDTQRTRVVPLLLHGDGAVAGQGIVAECLNMSQLEGYTVGGTIHIVINNLIAFTTLPQDGRSTEYCTDIAKSIDVPIFHVNGEDPVACAQVGRLAMEYRQTFKKDVFVDLCCYRKFGHNETDEQSYTQPILAGLIKTKAPLLTSYTKQLAETVITPEDAAKITSEIELQLDAAQSKAKKAPIKPVIDPGTGRWDKVNNKFTFDAVKTAVTAATLSEVAAALSTVPQGFVVNPKLKGVIDERAAIATGGMVSYANGEMLAYGSLMLEGSHVRVSGQDVRRGTFTHRHAVLRDVNTGVPHVSLNHMRPHADPSIRAGEKVVSGTQAEMSVFDSPLSEYAVVGFDYGYSMADPNELVVWEAQFGDFCNGAQIIIDQYLASSEIKWSRWSGMVMLLPHGYEGAGPEHSSARLERFLSLCADDNMLVVYPTTGAQIFHALRRQVRASYRKPLIVMNPKSLLRTPTSMVEELTSGGFQEFIDDPAFSGKEGLDKKAVKRVLFCCGKLYYELAERRKALAKRDVAIIRIEQLYPFHADLARKILGTYSKSAEVCFVQEEPRNAGAYIYLADFMREKLGISPQYIGRPASATPAVGSKRADKYLQEAVIAAAIGAKPKGDGKADSKADEKK